ncbi:MAG: FecR domain-containing protein [Polyangiaceae bacterium]
MEELERLEALGRRISNGADEQLARRPVPPLELEVENIRAGLMERQRRRRMLRRTWVALPVVAAAAAAVLLFFGSRSPAEVSFRVHESAGVVGSWVAAPAKESVSLDFSEGSKILVEPGGRARVGQVSSNGARIILERGGLDARVVHRARTDWAVSAGPFSVQVTGTHFKADWDPKVETLRVELLEGNVVVRGACLDGDEFVVVGEPAVFHCPSPVAAGPAAPPLPATDVAPMASRSPAASPERRAPFASAAPATEGWEALARAGKYRPALAAAEAAGFDALASSASAPTLLLLGDTARYAGNPARAAQAYTRLRTANAGSEAAATAAFHLARLAPSPAEAERWLETYLRERPGGALAQEALGRLLETQYRRGGKTAAQGSAVRYLASYPNGAHAELARSITTP